MLSILFVLVALIGISPIWFSLYICFSSFQHILILTQFHNMFEKLIFFAAANSMWKCLLLRCVQLFVTPWSVAHQASLSLGFPGKKTGVGCPFILQGIFPTHGYNPGLPHYRQILYCLSHRVSPKIGTRDGTQDIFLWIPQGYNIVIQCYIGRDHTCYIDKIFTLGLGGVWDEVIYIWPHSLWPLSWVETKTQTRNHSVRKGEWFLIITLSLFLVFNCQYLSQLWLIGKHDLFIYTLCIKKPSEFYIMKIANLFPQSLKALNTSYLKWILLRASPN